MLKLIVDIPRLKSPRRQMVSKVLEMVRRNKVIFREDLKLYRELEGQV
jgi:hypothetical protein